MNIQTPRQLDSSMIPTNPSARSASESGRMDRREQVSPALVPQSSRETCSANESLDIDGSKESSTHIGAPCSSLSVRLHRSHPFSIRSPSLFNVLLLLLSFSLQVAASLRWPILGSGSSDTLKTIAGLSREEFESGLHRNVQMRSSDVSNPASPTGTPAPLETARLDKLMETYQLGQEVKWTYNDLNSMNVSGIFGTLVGFGDFESKGHVDMVFITEIEGGQLAVSVRVWDHASGQFVPGPVFPLPSYIKEVSSVIPVDVNMDGSLDLVMTVKGSGDVFDLVVMLQDAETHKLEVKWNSADHSKVDDDDFKSTVHYVLMDINFDSFPDFVGQLDPSTVSSKYSASQGRFVWVNYYNKEDRDSAFVPSFWGFGDTRASLRYPVDSDGGGPLSVLSSPHSSAFLDLNGDCVPDLVFDVTSSSSHQRSLEIWLSHSVAENGRRRLEGEDTPEAEPISKSTGSRIKDFFLKSVFPTRDGSSSPPLGSKIPVYVLSDKHRLDLPTGTQQLSFADVTGDGTIDVVAAACTTDSRGTCTGDDRIVMFGNRQVPVCQDFGFGKPLSPCRQSSFLCQSGDFSWDSSVDSSPLNPFDDSGTKRHFVGSAKFPVTLRIGDFDSDGYPDILSLVKGSSSNSDAMLFRNTRGDESLEQQLRGFPFRLFPWGKNATDETRERSASPTYRPHKLLTVPDASVETAAFFDLGEDGRLDVVAATEPISSWFSESKPSKLVSFLHGEDGRLFMRSTGLSGACPSRQHCEGSLSHGATFKLTGSDLGGSRFARALPILSQSAYSPLQIPHALTGLGRTNNYIDYLFYGIAYYKPSRHLTKQRDLRSAEDQPKDDQAIPSIRKSEHFEDTLNYHRWIAIIPNSFIIANPYPRDDASKWNLDLSVSPSKYFGGIFAATAISLIAIGVVICVLDSREKAEDLKERQGFRRHFIAVG